MSMRVVAPYHIKTTDNRNETKHRNKPVIIISNDVSTLLLFYCNLKHYDGRDSTPTLIHNNLLIGANHESVPEATEDQRIQDHPRC